MPEIIPDHVPSPRTLLAWDGTAYRPVSIDAAGRLQVRGEDQLFSFHEPLINTRTAVISGADGRVDSNSPPAGEIWVVTNIAAQDVTSPTTQHYYFVRNPADIAYIYKETAAFAAGDWSNYGGHAYLTPGDMVRAFFTGALAADSCRVDLHGYVMTLET